MASESDDGVLAAEMAVIGHALLGTPAGGTYSGGLNHLDESDYYLPRHAIIHAAITRLLRDARPVDVITVSAELEESGDLRRVGGRSGLHELMSGAPFGSAVYYAGLVRKYAQARHLKGVGVRLTTMAGPHALDDVAEIQAIAQQELSAMPADLDSDDLSGSLEAHTARVIRYTPEQPDEWLIPGLLARLDRVMITGYEGMAKSTLIRQVGGCVAAGLNPWNGARVSDGHRVLVVDCENNDKQTRRGLQLLGARIERRMFDPGWDSRMFTFTESAGMNLTKPRDSTKFHRWADAVRPDLIIVGPVYKLMKGSDRTSDNEVMELLSFLDDLRVKHNAAMLVEAHSPLPTGNQTDRPPRPFGSSVQLGWPEIGFGIRPDNRPIVQDLRAESDMLHKRASFMECVNWRGQRELRDWPSFIRFGSPHQLPWVPTTEGWAPSIDSEYSEQPPLGE